MRSLSKSNRCSLKKSRGTMKGIPHTTISLNQRGGRRSINKDLSFHSTKSRENDSESAFRVVSIGSVCR